MTCGFMNSAGTDLDNLFLVNNSNAGALGFQCSNAQDLGNRFSSANKLGYGVGYQNSAGTDIGNLRGAGGVPVWSSHSVTLGARNIDNNESACDYEWPDGEISSSHRVGVFAGWFNVKGVCTGVGNAGVNWQVCACYMHNESGYTHVCSYKYADNSTDGTSLWKNYAYCPYDGKPNKLSVANGVESSWITIFNAGTGASTNRNFAYCLVVGDGGNRRPWSNFLRVYQRFYNSLGSTSWVATDLAIDV